MTFKPLPIATRRSNLALAQARWVQAALARAAGVEPEGGFPLQPHVTTGDREQAASLSAIGGKGLFTKEIETALLTGGARIAVHSMKDMPAEMPEGLILAAVPVRADPRDAFVAPGGAALETLPQGARIGTSSVRRAAQVKRLRPDVEVVPFRGNVETRLKKLADGVAAGTFLAEAGLSRLHRTDVPRVPMAPGQMLPALGQGFLCIQAHIDDEEARAWCAAIDDPDAHLCAVAERTVLETLDGSCRTPMAGYARITEDGLVLDGELLALDGSDAVTDRAEIPLTGDRARDLVAVRDAATHLAHALLRLAPEAITLGLTAR